MVYSLALFSTKNVRMNLKDHRVTITVHSDIMKTDSSLAPMPIQSVF